MNDDTYAALDLALNTALADACNELAIAGMSYQAVRALVRDRFDVFVAGFFDDDRQDGM